MIQTLIKNEGSVPTQLNYIYLDLYDKMTNTDYRPLVEFTSQFTGKTKIFSTNFVVTNKERYIELSYRTVRSLGEESLVGGMIYVGTTDFPLGLYDVSIYQNTSNENLDPTGLILLYTGLMKMAMSSGETQPIEYTEYTTNDSDTDTIYITNS